MTENSGKKLKSSRQTDAPGVIKVHESVIAAIVRKAALSVPGVLRLAGNSLVDNIAELVGSRRIQDRSITVSVSQDSEVSAEVKLIVEYGPYVPDIAGQVRQKVYDEITKFTGMSVSKVNVVIFDLEDPSENGSEKI